MKKVKDIHNQNKTIRQLIKVKWNRENQYRIYNFNNNFNNYEFNNNFNN